MAFTPKMFISIGATGAFYTLRETYEHEFYLGGKRQTETRSFHHFNLSQDADEALEKARAAATAAGLELRANRDEMCADMREITRATAEEMERRRAAEAAREVEWAEARAARDAEYRAMITKGVVSFGRYAGTEIPELPLGYVQWIVGAEFEAGSLMALLANTIRASYPDMVLPAATGDHVGAIGERINASVRVIRTTSFVREAYSGFGTETVFVTTMRDEATGGALVVFSAAFSPKLGQRLNIRATVKKHDWRDGRAQTIVQRVAVK